MKCLKFEELAMLNVPRTLALPKARRSLWRRCATSTACPFWAPAAWFGRVSRERNAAFETACDRAIQISTGKTHINWHKPIEISVIPFFGGGTGMSACIPKCFFLLCDQRKAKVLPAQRWVSHAQWRVPPLRKTRHPVEIASAQGFGLGFLPNCSDLARMCFPNSPGGEQWLLVACTFQ